MRARTRTLPLAALLFCTAVAAIARPLPLRAQDFAPAPPSPDDVRDLSLVEVRARAPRPRIMGIMLSSDGGWVSLPRQVSETLAEAGIPVVGFNSRAFMSRKRTPDELAAALTRVLRHYEQAWHADRFVIMGYSRGAEWVPFALTRLPADLRAHVQLAVMLGMETNASFEFHLIDLVENVHRASDLPVLPELARLRGMRMLCVYGEDESESACRQADPSLITRIERPGKHHFDGDYRALGAIILQQLG